MRPFTLSSTDPKAEVHACGVCQSIYGKGTSLDQAERCCTCTRCGAEVPNGGPFAAMCDSCKQAQRDERAVKAHERALDLPVVPDDGGPVYIESMGHHNNGYFESLELAASTIWDESAPEPGEEEVLIDWGDIIVHPCIVSPASTRDLEETVSEGWAECFDDYDDALPEDLAVELRELQKKVEAAAPKVWNPDHKKRVLISAPPEAS